MASTSKPLVRHARREDVPEILALINELADYEKELASVEATEAKLLATIAFAPSPSSSSTTPDAQPPTSTTDSHGLPVTEPTTPLKPARCLLIFPSASPSSSDKPIGMALYFYNYSTWRAKAGIFLEDLYVRQTERNKGYGKRLLVKLAEEVVAMDGGRLEWSVLKWNEPSIRFYEDVVGATRMEEWVGMRVDREALVRLTKLLD
ncbi:acyl-CoA N-acyltransferase [Coniella lustricola]|uniref:Acyl-CoA N-acyltransferase n=1 Tax=Coniella lustricola TaxID=2025994 RepID=A0A2T3A3W3_9PEZI|nr:acyl-CoA N-acyltransferase [Coniella lustricola]